MPQASIWYTSARRRPIRRGRASARRDATGGPLVSGNACRSPGGPDHCRDGPAGDRLGRCELDRAGRPASHPRCSPGSAALSTRCRLRPGVNTARSSTSTPRRLSQRNCWPRWRRWRAAATRWPGPTGGGDSVGILSICTGRRRAPSGCFRSLTARSRKPGGIASKTTSSSKTGRGTTRGLAGSTRSTCAWCRGMRWR